MNALAEQNCKPDVELLNSEQIEHYLVTTPQWTTDNDYLVRRFQFDNYQQTVSFVKVVAGIADAQDHHPEIQFSYKHCTISYTTHSVGGLSVNDFICAARIDALD